MRASVFLSVLAACGLFMSMASAQSLPAGFSDALVLSGWSSPVGAAWDANGRMYVWEKRGRVWIVENGVKLPTPLLNIEQEVGNWGDHGMLGFALDPDFLSNGRFYVMYAVDRHHLLYFGTPTYDPFVSEPNAASIVRITRYTAQAPGYLVADPASRTILLGESLSTGAPILYNTHGAGTLLFARDGTLIASIGEGASAASTDVGNATESYFAQGLADGIIREEENVGAFRAQLVNSFSGKILRMDPTTGNGVPSNPFFDPAAPRAPRSRVWALGLRNPYRLTLKPGTGSTDPSDADVGTLLIGDVGWSNWEEHNVCTEPGQNFGWPLYEGMEASSYAAVLTYNRDEPNPLFNGTNCTVPFFRFQDLLKQDTPSHVNGHPNPCNAATQIPNSIPKFFHTRPAVDWQHGERSRCGAFNGSTAVTFDLDDPLSPVPGPRFGGYAAIGGPWGSWSGYPAEYQNSAFHGDYAGGWIRRFVYDDAGEVLSVHDFGTVNGAINWLGAGPDGCLWYIKYNGAELRRICNLSTVNLPPVAMVSQSLQYGTSPLMVAFDGSASSDPENGSLVYSWDFGDGSLVSSAVSPSHLFTAPLGVPTSFTVTLTVTDDAGQHTSTTVLVSLNNTPPVVSINSFADGAFYPIGMDTTWQLTAAVSDAEHSGAQLSHAWQVILHHNTHEHPGAVVNAVSSSAITAGEGCDGQYYAYEVRLTVTDAAGLSATDVNWLYPRCYAVAPTAVIQVSALAGFAPFEVFFDGSASYDPGSIVSYQWNFGDGTSSLEPSPSKTYTDLGDHVVTLMVTDNDGLTGTASRTISLISLGEPQCHGPAGGLVRQVWNGVGGSTVADLTNSPNYPNNPTTSGVITSFQGPTNAGSNFGDRVRGFIVPPESGAYTFTLTSDDASAVFLSLNEEPRFKRQICSVPLNTLETEFGKYPTQVSETIELVAGAYYYVELLHKEGSGNDHFALRWQTPSNSVRTVIPGTALVQWADCPPGLRLRVNLGGPYHASSNLMRDDLRAAGLLPLSEPYSALGYSFIGGGGESTSPARLAITGANAVVDWVLVELRDKNNPSQVVASRAALLERDGDAVGTDGWARLNFNVPPDQYYIAVRHRNHLGAMSAGALRLDASEVSLDLTLSSTPTYGSMAQSTMASGRTALWWGDVNRDGKLKYVGNGNDRDLILVAIGGTTPSNTVFGYRQEDVDLSGSVKYTGQGNDRDPILLGIGGSTPTATRLQQLP